MRIALTHNINHHDSDEEQEFDTPDTIAALTEALSLRHEVHPIECDRNVSGWLEILTALQPDLVFSVAEGFSSAAREAFYPALYEQLGLRYTGSDPTTMLITHNKALTKRFVSDAGVRVPWSVAICSEEELDHFQNDLVFPLIIKPNSEGSSLGLNDRSVISDLSTFKECVRFIWQRFNSVALVEQYVAKGIDVSMSFIEGLGRDGVFGPVVYGYPTGEIFDYAAKAQTYSESILLFPQDFSEDLLNDLHVTMLRSVISLDVRGYGRADFRIDPGGTLYFLEMNGQAEIKPTRSDFMAPVLRAGYKYEEAVLHIAEFAAARVGRHNSMAGLLARDYINRRITSFQGGTSANGG